MNQATTETGTDSIEKRSAAAAGPQARNKFAGWVLPGLADFTFVSVLGWLFYGEIGASSLLGDGDTGWHIRLGDIFLRDGGLPETDPFSFSMAGRVWFAWEWLADVILALVHQLDGLQGVALLAGVVIALTAALLLRYMLWLRVNLLLAIAGMMLCCSVSTIHWLARPHMFTWVFLTISLWLLEADRRASTRWVWLLVPLAAAWTNIHGGFVALLVTTAVFAAGAAAEDVWRGERGFFLPQSAKRYGLLFVLCLAATVVNPYGVQLHTHVFAYLQSDFILQHVAEFQSPSFRSEAMKALEITLLASIFACGSMLRRGDFIRPLLIAAWAHAALTSARHAPLFMIIATPYLLLEATRLLAWGARQGYSVAQALEDLSGDYTGDRRPASERGPMLGWLSVGCVIVIAGLLNSREAQGMRKTAFPPERFPAVACDALGERLRTKRILTTDQWGDYLIYRLFPDYRAFIDGRSDFYDPEIRDDYLDMLGPVWTWERHLDKYRFEGALLPLDWAVTGAMKRNPEWTLVYDDGYAAYFERKQAPGPARGPIWEAVEGAWISPKGGVESPRAILLGGAR